MKMSRSAIVVLIVGAAGLLLAAIALSLVQKERQWRQEGAFIEAVDNGSYLQVKKFLADGISPNLRNVGQARRSLWSTRGDNIRGTPVLIEAVYWQHPGIVHLLLKQGADINDADPSGQTPLKWAALYPVESGSTPMVKLLLEFHPDVNAADVSRTTAAHIAARQNHVEVVRLLAANSAKKSRGKTEE